MTRLANLERETVAQFRALRQAVQDDLGRTELTNDEFLSILLDAYSTQREHEGRALVADGGTLTCRCCGSEQDPTHNYCANCGEVLPDDGQLVADGGHKIESSEEARRKGKQSGKTERETHECPKCGGEFANLPAHLRGCSGELRADGGVDPADDPRACSKCGTHIGFGTDDYCEGCQRELGIKPPLRRCRRCGDRLPEEEMEAVDVSPPDEYYPEFEYFCPGCGGGR